MQKRKTLIIVLLILLLIAFSLALSGRKEGAQTERTAAEQGDTADEQTDMAADQTEMTMEEYERELFKNQRTEPQGPIELAIVSPEEETFIPRQARMYEAVITNYRPVSLTGYDMASCRWKFYLNESNEESLYKEKTNRATLTAQSTNICGFTDTFIESRGELRVELNLDILDKDGNIVTTYVADRKYRVQ